MNSDALTKIAHALANGFTVGPRSACAACGITLEDFDTKCAGLCEQCLAAVEALNAKESA